jgi:chemotaxis protein MotB
VEGKIDIESGNNQVVIRIRERGSFASGQAILDPSLLPLVSQLRYALQEIAGTISVEGHTDNVPIKSPAFDSNWNLSASRALSVARELMSGGELDESRFVVVGHADTRPLRPNDSAESRAANRRVEIVVRGDVNYDPSPWTSTLSTREMLELAQPPSA